MSLRRTVVAFVVALVCALAGFTLPRFVWNTRPGAARPQQPTTTDSVALVPAPASTPQGAPRSIPQRLTGIFGIALILGIGIALSRNRHAISSRVVGWGVVLQLVFAILVLRFPAG